jgi:hypothetical protein
MSGATLGNAEAEAEADEVLPRRLDGRWCPERKISTEAARRVARLSALRRPKEVALLLLLSLPLPFRARRSAAAERAPNRPCEVQLWSGK